MIWFVSLIAYLAGCILAGVGVSMWLEGQPENVTFRVRHLLGILFWPFAAVYLLFSFLNKRLPR